MATKESEKQKEVDRAKEQRKRSLPGRNKLDYTHVYGRSVPEMDLFDFRYRFKLIRPDRENIWINRLVTDWSVTDDGGDSLNDPTTVTGEMTVIKPPEDQTGAKLEIHEGHEVEIYIEKGGKLEEDPLWRLRIYEPTVQYGAGTWRFSLQDDTKLLAMSTDDFDFRKSKKRPKGWYAHDIVREVARLYRIPLGRIAEGTVPIKKKTFKKESPIEVVRWAYERESEETGIDYVIRWERGALNVTRLRRNPLLYVLARQILSAEIAHLRRAGVFATVLTVNGRGKVEGKTKKIKVRVTDERLIKQYGFIHRSVSEDQIETEAEARGYGKATLARRVATIRSVSLEHPDIPYVRRGDAIQVHIPEEGIEGIDEDETGMFFVVGVTHQGSGGDATMSLRLGLKDPADPRKLREKRDKAERENKRKKKDEDDDDGDAPS